jgi:hypothetical protein
VKRDIDRREFLKRGSAAGVAATAGLGAVRAAPPAAPDAALALADRQLDSREFCLSMYDTITPSLAFGAQSRSAAQRWQGRARAKVVELLGGFPAERVPLDAEVLETRDFGSYTRERVVFQTRRNLSAVGYLLLPKNAQRPLPVVIAFPGHGRGLDDVVGNGPDGQPSGQREGVRGAVRRARLRDVRDRAAGVRCAA